ncbi:MAG: glycosyltransferase family 2 protein [Gammaproteobacteria bacterium]
MIKKVCVILPTYNEAENVKFVIPGIFAQARQLSSHELHVLVVDDNSPDGTQDVVSGLMKQYKNLHLISGKKEGLGEAYKRGMAYVSANLRSDLVFEMDADGQHDAALIPLFVDLANHGFSLVIGSRFAPGGSTPDFSLRRKLISRVGNWMIRFLGGLPRIHDCTSGFRCIKTDVLEKCEFGFLSTRGYSFQSSLLVELLRNGAKVIEVPIVFPDRQYGESKLSMRDQVEFLLNIAKIRFRQSEEFIKFLGVGISGVFVNLGIYIFLTRMMGVPIDLAPPIAIEVSIITNFLLNHYWTFTGRKTETSFLWKLFRFHLAAGIAGILNYTAFLILLKVFGLHDILSNIIGIGLGALVNYFLNSYWTWKQIEVDTGAIDTGAIKGERVSADTTTESRLS